MGVPFEALLPYGIMIAMFGISGGGMAAARFWQHGHKKHRWGLDTWDMVVLERDRRLTGHTFGSREHHVAPPGYELTSAWRLEKRMV